MVLSLGCSAAIYHFSSNELARNTRRQVSFFDDQLPPPDFRSFANLRQNQLIASRQHLKGELAVFNLLVLVGGGAISYGLARRTLRPIEESHEAQARFAADASHELRTPLTAMQTEIEVGLRSPALTKADAVKLLKSNLEEVAKLKSLSEGLLKLAGQAGHLDLNKTISSKQIVAESVNRVLKSAKAKKIAIKDSSSSQKITADKPSLVEVLVILLDNAVRYSPAGSQVVITSGKKDDFGFIKIKDQGQGIDPVDLPNIFNRFYRADASRSKNQAEGYGLGLAIAKKIVDSHKGHIDVSSAVGKGSSFTVYLPLAVHSLK